MYSNIHGFEHHHPGVFQETYSCHPLPNDRINVYYGGKIILPPSALQKLSILNIVYPMLFQIYNKKKNRYSHAGVLEFIAEEGRVYLPPWLMETLSLEEKNHVEIKSITLDLGRFVKIQPQAENFLDITDPKAVLENAFRNFSSLTLGDFIQIHYNNKTYKIKVLQVNESKYDESGEHSTNGISILETDLEVDFEPPPGYTEKKKIQQNSTMADKLKIEEQQVETKGFSAFQGSGQNLKGNTVKDTSSSSSSAVASSSKSVEKVNNVQQKESDNVPAPLRMPFGKLFFGYKIIPLKSSKDEEAKEPTLKFPGEGNKLKSISSSSTTATASSSVVNDNQ